MKKKFDVNIRDRYGNTVFHYNENENKLKSAIIQGKFDVNTKDYRYGDTIFHHGNHSKYLKLALEYGLNPNIKNNYNQTIFHENRFIKKQDLLFAIEKGLDLYSQDDSGNTVIHSLMTVFWNIDISDILQKHFDFNLNNKDGDTIFHMQNDFTKKYLKFAIENKLFNVNLQNNNGL